MSEYVWKTDDRTEVLGEKHCPTVILSTTNPTPTGLVSNAATSVVGQRLKAWAWQLVLIKWNVSQTRLHSEEWIVPNAMYKGADKSLARPGRKQANVSVRIAWISFGALPCGGGEENLMTARVSMLLKSRASLTCFRACFIHGRAKDLSAPRVMQDCFLCVKWCKNFPQQILINTSRVYLLFFRRKYNHVIVLWTAHFNHLRATSSACNNN